MWDGSVLETPEPIKNDDLCAVRSSKARRLKHIRQVEDREGAHDHAVVGGRRQVQLAR